jgi:parvulin-like peptidyl-prolyl isomerase
MRVGSAVLLGGGILIAACHRDPAAVGDPRQLPVARVGNHFVTVGDVERSLGEESMFEKSPFRTDAEKKEYVDRFVRYELLAEEALRRGYDNDPEIQRALRKQMAMKLVKEEFLADRAAPIGDADVEKYYREHQDEFRQPRQVRALQIVVDNRAAAERVFAEAKRLGADDQAGFRALVMKYSTDESTRKQGGDLLFVDAGSQVRQPLLGAILALKTPGELGGPVDLGGRFHILRLAEVREASVTPLAQVQNSVRRKLAQAAQARDVEAFIDKLRKDTRVDTFPGNLAKVENKTKLAPRTVADRRATTSIGGP